MSRLEYKPSYKEQESVYPLTRNQLFLAKPANAWIESAKLQPVPKMLFSEFFHEGELSILFADTNLGKSILAVQIADSISKGKRIPGMQLTAKQQAVLYFDFEMSAKQFEKRYSENYQNHYQFDSNLIRVELNPDCTEFSDFEQVLFNSIEAQIENTGARVLVLDNLTYLKSQAVDTAKEALPLMKSLKELKIKHELSLLILAHTPKRNTSKPITVNDLSGSRQLANFADSIFAVGSSNQGSAIRYIKQIKARATELIYDSDNVMVCEINQPDNFLGFEFLDFGREVYHLALVSEDEKDHLDLSILELKTSQPELSDAEIAKQTGTYRKKVYRVLKKHQLK